MSDAARLQEAFELIEKGDLNNARQLLNPLRNRMQNDPDFWWVYAHAVETQDEGREAIQQLRQLDNAYPGLETLERRLDTVPRPKMLPPSPASIPDLPGDDFDDDFDFTDDEKEPSSNRVRNIVIALVAVAVIVLFAILALPRLVAPSSEPTAVANLNPSAEPIIPTVATDEMTEEATIESTPLPTEISLDVEATSEVAVEATEVSAQSTSDLLSADLSAFQVPDGGIQLGATALGESVIIDLCTTLGPASTTAIVGIIDTIASADLAIPNNTQALVFSVKDCVSDIALIVLGLDVSDVTSYIGGDTSRAQLLQAMQRID